MKKNNKLLLGISLGVIIIAVILFASLGHNSQNTVQSNPSGNPATSSNSNSNANQLSTGSQGFKISAIVENNVDPATGQAAPDHLEITFTNTINKDISNFTVYYSITDLKTNQKEEYNLNLDNFILKAGETQIIHIDGENKPNHYPVNKYSLYYLSQDKLKFVVDANSPGYEGQETTVNKDAGGAEQPD
jgi:hypothetical protein